MLFTSVIHFRTDILPSVEVVKPGFAAFVAFSAVAACLTLFKERFWFLRKIHEVHHLFEKALDIDFLRTRSAPKYEEQKRHSNM